MYARGLWKKELVVGQASLENPDAQLDIRLNNQQVYNYTRELVSDVDRDFGSPLHHFGGDEVAYIWNTADDNKLFNTFLNWTKTLAPNKTTILWDDPLTDPEKDITLAKDWVIQTWHKGTTQKILDKGHRVIVSESDVFYIGNANAKKISSFKFPGDPKVMGYEIAWFTSEEDNPNDIEKDWVVDPIKAASKIQRP